MLKFGILTTYLRYNELPSKYGLGPMRIVNKLAKSMASNIEIKVYTFDIEQADDEKYFNELYEQIIEDDLDAFGLSLFSYTIEVCLRLRRKLKDSNIQTFILGGSEVELLDKTDWVGDEYLIFGEGDRAVVEICQMLNESPDYLEENYLKVSNCCRMSDDTRNIKKEHLHLPTESTYPLFSYDLPNVAGIEKEEFAWWETTRGCPNNCAYCGHKTRPDMSSYSLDFTAEEIKNIGKSELKHIFIVDPILGGNKKRGIEILELFRKYAPDVKISGYLHPNIIDEEYINVLSRSFIGEMRIGIQSLNPDVPTWIRNNSLKAIHTYLPLLSKNYIPWRAELIIGLPGDTVQGFMKTLEFVIDKLNPTFLFAYHLKLIPNTPLASIIVDSGEAVDIERASMWIRQNEEQNACESNSYSEHELLGMVALGNKLTSFYNNNIYTFDDKFAINMSPCFQVIYDFMIYHGEKSHFGSEANISYGTWLDYWRANNYGISPDV